MVSLFKTMRFEPETGLTTQPGFDRNLEGLRGLAALTVAHSHILGTPYLLTPNYSDAGLISYVQFAHTAVLLFFLLSGYVIGMTNTAPFTYEAHRGYLLRRIVRIYPIYWFCITLDFLVYPDLNILGWIEGWAYFLVVPPSVRVWWSLNYELVYYVLFFFIWKFRPNVAIIMVSLLAVSCIGWFFSDSRGLITSYCSGLIFWLLGLLFNWKLPQATEKIRLAPLLSYFFLLVCTNHMQPGFVILYALGFKTPGDLGVCLAAIATLPLTMVVFADISGRKLPLINWLKIFSYLLPAGILVLMLLMGRAFENERWTVTSVTFVLSLATLFWRTDVNILSRFAFLGQISYAVYILHFPVAWLIRACVPINTGIPVLDYILLLVVWLITTLVLSILLELIMQPRIKAYMYRTFLLKKAKA